MKGFNPQQLVARGVFDSLKELDRVMCELDDARPGPQVIGVSWSQGMDFTVRSQKFNRAYVGSGVGEEVGSNVAPLGTAAVSPMREPVDVKPPVLCIFCAWERAMQPGPRMARPRINGDVVLGSCARHSSDPAVTLPAGVNARPECPTPPAQSLVRLHMNPTADACHSEVAPGLLSGAANAEPFHPQLNPNAGVMPAFPKGRWS